MTERLSAILEAEHLQHLLDNFTSQGVTDSILSDLTDSDLKDLGVEKLGERKRLLVAFRASPVAPTIATAGSSAEPIEGPAAVQSTAPSPKEATKETPFTNILGMPFVPIPRFDTRFCIWPVRVQDYEAYCAASGAKFPEIPFAQESDHPIVGVTWNDAIEFCVWLTGKERAEGKIGEKIVYRLPTDLEWSAAVGLPHETEASPEERHLRLDGYPWGLRWPPPKGAGNYEHQRSGDHFRLKFRMQQGKAEADGWDQTLADGNYFNLDHAYRMVSENRRSEQFFKNEYNKWLNWKPVDEYAFTSAVQSFSPNRFGIYDLGGNVWEWCMDSNLNDECVLRGASFSISPKILKVYQEVMTTWDAFIDNKDLYKSTFRWFENKGKASSKSIYDETLGNWARLPDGGFRIVVASC
jgi:hypothetical protein